MSDSNNPQGTASLSADEADSKIASILGFETTEGSETATAADEADAPSNTDADATEEHRDTDSEGEEQPHEDEEPEPVEAPSLSDDTEIEVNGERLKVKDLKSGYLRQSDYTRKTQELAQQRQHLESQLRNDYGNHLRTIEQNLIDHFPREPNWQELAEDNPAQYAVEKEAWNKRLSDLNGIRQLRAQAEQQAVAQRDQAIAQAQAVAYENLVQMHPEFAKTSDGKVSPVSAELVSFALNEVGLPEQLLQQVDDARVFSLLYDAMRYRRGEAQKSKTLQSIANKPPLTRPGTKQSQSSAATADYQKQRAILKRTGRSEDADSLIAGILFNN